MLAEARQVLRAKFLAADVGITGANFLVAETGTSIIVTNEGNGDLTQILPEAHIVIASIEKIVPTLEDAAQLLRVLARSATGQDASVYTTLSTGPRRPGDPDGPRAYHVVILDNGRSAMLGGEFEDMLRCIRCGACMNHCPVYQAVGGHAYGWVYPGPMGAVLTPSLIGVAEGGQLPNASTFCGRCEEVCPVRIPLPGMMRHWREREFERRLSPAPMRYGLGFWAFFASRPALYRMATGIAARALHLVGRNKGRFASLPFAGGWTRYRDLAAPAGGHVPEPVAIAQRSGAMSSRAAVFASIRRSLAVTGDEATRRFEVETRLKQAPPGIVPKRGQGDVASQARHVQSGSRARSGKRDRGAGMGGCAGGNRPLLSRKQLSGDLAHGRRSASWGHAVGRNHARDSARPLRRRRRSTPSRPRFAGVAETGTLALVSGPDNPTTLNFLPDNHIVLLPREAIEADYESVFAKLRSVYGKGDAPRTLNFITGPSRSADIEQTLLLGGAWAPTAAYRRRRLNSRSAPNRARCAVRHSQPVHHFTSCIAARNFYFAIATNATVLSPFEPNGTSLASFGLGGNMSINSANPRRFAVAAGYGALAIGLALRGGQLCVS